MTDEQRWMRVLEAHADEHAAMAEHGVPRVTRLGRERGIGSFNLPPYQSLGALTPVQTNNAVGAAVIVTLAIGALWYANS